MKMALYLYFAALHDVPLEDVEGALEDLALERQMPYFWRERQKKRRRRRFFPIPGKVVKEILHDEGTIFVAESKVKKIGSCLAGPIMERSTNGAGGVTKSGDGRKTPINRRQRRWVRQQLREKLGSACVLMDECWSYAKNSTTENDPSPVMEDASLQEEERTMSRANKSMLRQRLVIMDQPTEKTLELDPEPEEDGQLDVDPIHAEVEALFDGYDSDRRVALHEFATALADRHIHDDKQLAIVIGQANKGLRRRHAMVEFTDDPDEIEDEADRWLNHAIGRESHHGQAKPLPNRRPKRQRHPALVTSSTIGT